MKRAEFVICVSYELCDLLPSSANTLSKRENKGSLFFDGEGLFFLDGIEFFFQTIEQFRGAGQVEFLFFTEHIHGIQVVSNPLKPSQRHFCDPRIQIFHTYG